VSNVLPEELLHVTRGERRAPAEARRHVASSGKRVRLFPGYEIRAMRAFRANVPALDLFPTDVWTQITSRRLRRLSARQLLGCEPMGYAPLRHALADYLGTSRGVTCTPEQIAIVSGVQEALDLVARLFLNPRDRVCMEDPGYIGASVVFEAAGAKIVPAPLDDEGMTLRESRMRGVRLAYVTPAHQFPVGITMSLARRLELLEWARKAGAWIFEDDYDSEYRYEGRPVPSLQGLDRHGLVLYAGTFSKVLFPGLRLGYLVVPPDVVDRVAAMKSVTNRHASLLDQVVLCDFITDGHFGRHIRRMREIYAERRSVLLESAQRRLEGLLEIVGVDAGLQTAGWLVDGIDARSAAAAAAKRNVEVTPLSDYGRRASREGLHLGFAAVDAQEIRRGVRELAAALEGLR
jgi:GntR family transcriptional regulator/MocR family aminotransferase